MHSPAQIYFISAKLKRSVSDLNIRSQFIKEVCALNKSIMYPGTFIMKFDCIRFLGAAALIKTEEFIPSHSLPKIIFINKHKLDEVLTEFNIEPRMWKLCHKYLVGAFKMIQINAVDLVQFI